MCDSASSTIGATNKLMQTVLTTKMEEEATRREPTPTNEVDRSGGGVLNLMFPGVKLPAEAEPRPQPSPEKNLTNLMFPSAKGGASAQTARGPIKMQQFGGGTSGPTSLAGTSLTGPAGVKNERTRRSLLGG